MLKEISNTLFIRKQKKVLQNELKRLSEQYKLTRKFPEYGTSEDENVQEVEKFQENLSLQKNLKNLIQETKGALARIDKNKYDVCEKCHAQIETGRLKAYPSANLCVTCASLKFRKK
ncbi:MAG: DnaK suppressor protein [Berkelbacteria bacterium GW2011_GWA1_36_9]|uniref:DnaK suppressor protein n=1 Tax=Berkelbacteria bacterium GW2011_GWA1_36_9 TaxID=1618331 RepID=A0A0G0FUK0_9BACT|nr:MAG: DnaK suppressor protein [Berkelbacteria bacterium GW2011_GWA1_36_9]